MKVLCYNILSGGFNSYHSTNKFPQRLPLLKKALYKIDADFVSLIDTFRWKEVFSDADLRKHFGYKYVYCIDMNDTRVDKRIGLTVLSKFPMKNQMLRIYNRNAIQSSIKIGGCDYEIITTYLDDLSEDTRLDQVKSLLTQVTKKNTIVMGDLNTFTKNDLNYGPTLLDKMKMAFKMKPKELLRAIKIMPAVRQMKRAEVIEYLENDGFLNAMPNFEPTAPSKLFRSGFDEPFLRVDYALHTKDIKIKKASVLRSSLLDKTSDHFPVYFEI